MREIIVQQFKHPNGVLGRVAGWIMAHRASNLRRNSWAVSLLDIEPHDHVLELGCGPGIALKHVANLATEGRVVGIDHSELMVKAASKRNARAVATGRVEVIQRAADTVVDRGERFDRVLAVNVVQFWDEPVKTLRAVRAMMTPCGVIAIAFQPRNKGATDKDAERGAERQQQLLQDAGFCGVRIEALDLKPKVTCVLGQA